MLNSKINKAYFPFRQNKILTLIYNNYGPYHLARLAITSRLAEKNDYRVYGLELASREGIYPWVTTDCPEGNKYTIFPGKSLEELSAWDMARGTWLSLTKINPRAIAMGPSREAFAAYLPALLWARLKKRIAIIMMDTKYDDYPRHPLIERLKRKIFSLFDAALVAGTRSRQYAEFLGVSPGRIFVGCDVVDNDYFANGAQLVRENAASLRQRLGLPEAYFLFVGRFDEKKNVSGLLKAYRRYVNLSAIGEAWHLVLCGSGPLEDQLKKEVKNLELPQVVFTGFKQIEDLPNFYGLAKCLIVPSSHNEQWALVVNEAMASGLPVLVSRACGCAPDLVQEGVNGYTFNPFDVENMAMLMARMSSGAIHLGAMGLASRAIIANWGLDLYARNLLSAIEASLT